MVGARQEVSVTGDGGAQTRTTNTATCARNEIDGSPVCDANQFADGNPVTARNEIKNLRCTRSLLWREKRVGVGTRHSVTEH